MIAQVCTLCSAVFQCLAVGQNELRKAQKRAYILKCETYTKRSPETLIKHEVTFFFFKPPVIKAGNEWYV